MGQLHRSTQEGLTMLLTVLLTIIFLSSALADKIQPYKHCHYTRLTRCVDKSVHVMKLIDKHELPTSKGGLFVLCRALQKNIECIGKRLQYCPNMKLKIMVQKNILRAWEVFQESCQDPDQQTGFSNMPTSECSKALKKESAVCKTRLNKRILGLKQSNFTIITKSSKICRAQERFIACVHITSSGRCMIKTPLYCTVEPGSTPDYNQSFGNLSDQESPREKRDVSLIWNALTIDNIFTSMISFHFTMMFFVSLYALYLVFKPIGLPRNDPVIL